VQKALNLCLEPANDSGLDTSNTGAFKPIIVALLAAVIATVNTLSIGLGALFLSLRAILA
jgi:hypothetical protein